MHGQFSQFSITGFLLPEKYTGNGTFGDDFLAPSGTVLEAINTNPIWLALTLGTISVLEVVCLIETDP